MNGILYRVVSYNKDRRHVRKKDFKNEQLANGYYCELRRNGFAAKLIRIKEEDHA
jgi:hypothetical protein